MNQLTLENITRKITESNEILLVIQDTAAPEQIGCILALHVFLLRLGKKSRIIANRTLQPELLFLPHATAVEINPKLHRDFVITIFNPHAEIDEMKYTTDENGQMNIIITPKYGTYSENNLSIQNTHTIFDLVITSNCTDLKDLGSFSTQYKEVFNETNHVNISKECITETCSSAAEVLYHVMNSINPPLIDSDIATYLLLGIISETNNYQSPFCHEGTFRIASLLMQKGGRQQEIIFHLYKKRKLPTLQLWGKILSRIQEHPSMNILWSSLSSRELRASGASISEVTNVVDEFMVNAEHIRLVFLVIEEEPGLVSIFFRTKHKDINIPLLLQQLGAQNETHCQLRVASTEEAVQQVLHLLQTSLPSVTSSPQPVVHVKELQHDSNISLAKRLGSQIFIQ